MGPFWTKLKLFCFYQIGAVVDRSVLDTDRFDSLRSIFVSHVKSKSIIDIKIKMHFHIKKSFLVYYHHYLYVLCHLSSP